MRPLRGPFLSRVASKAGIILADHARLVVTYGPGEAGYVAALKTYDDAFAKFFDRLSSDGIDASNTLFIVTADENDHYAGQQAQNCDGVTTACVYNTVATNPKHGRYDVTNNGQSVATWTGPTTWPPAGTNGPLVGEMGYNMSWLPGTSIEGRAAADAPDATIAAFLGGDVSSSTRATIARATSAPQMSALTLGSPEFQRR